MLKWFTTVDHKDIGLLYLIFATVAALWGGVDAMMMRTELLTPPADIWAEETYNALFTTHGTTMLFFFVTPAFFGIANYVLPLMIGADDIAFPRLNAIGFWLLPPSLLLVRAGLLTDVLAKALGLVIPVSKLELLFALESPALGWTLYTPLSVQSVNPEINFFLLGMHLSGIATTMAAINFIVTIVTERGEDVEWGDLSVFVWSMLTTAGIVLFAFPLLGSAVLMLLLDRNFATTFFAVEGGGPLLWQHLFWFFGHPEVYIIFLPATGLMSTILPKFSGRKLFGYKFIVYSTLAIGVLSFGVWAHHMFTTGIDPRIRASFMVVSIAIAVPSAIKVFNWLTTMWKGNIRLTAPMILAVGGLGVFVIGGITGVFLASVPVDIMYQGTYYVVGHFHLILMGIIPFMMFAASYYWYPLITERLYDQRLARIQAVLLVVGAAVTFGVMVVLGALGMPRRYASYPGSYALLQQIITVGSYVIGLSVLLWLYNMVWSYFTGDPVRDADVWNLKRTGQFSREWERFEDRLVEEYGYARSEPSERVPSGVEQLDEAEREAAPTVLEDLRGFSRDFGVGVLGGAVGTALLGGLLYTGSLLGVFEIGAFSEFGELVIAESVRSGIALFALGGLTVWPLLIVVIADYLPYETNALTGMVLGTILAPGFALGFYGGQAGATLAGYLVLVLVGHWVYGAALAITFEVLSEYVEASLGRNSSPSDRR